MKSKKIVKWIAVIAAAIGAAAAVIMEQGCTHKHHLKASGIKIDTIEVSTTTKSSNMDKNSEISYLLKAEKRGRNRKRKPRNRRKRSIGNGPFVLIRNKKQMGNHNVRLTHKRERVRH